MIGETLALGVALSFTATALFAEVGSKRMGSLPFNAIRMTMSLLMLALALWLATGRPWPRFADGRTWLWLLASGAVGYVAGDYCLMKGYILIGSRFGQLFMTLSAPTAALFGRLLLGEAMGPLALAGMAVTLAGIAITVLARGDGDGSLRLKLPLKGVLYACGAGVGQGAGLVLSKAGLGCYEASIAAAGLTPEAVPDGALLHLPLALSVPFAATFIRGTIGIVGFYGLLMAFGHDWRSQLHAAVSDRRAMVSAAASMLFGPFVGVSLSLMATQFTSTGIAQTLFSLTPILIIWPAARLFHQRVTPREVLGAAVSVAGASLFFL